MLSFLMAVFSDVSLGGGIVFERGGSIYKRSLDEKGRAKLLSPRNVKVLTSCSSPDGRELVFCGQDVATRKRDFYHIDLTLGKSKQLTNGDVAAEVQELCWEPGQSSVIFAGMEATGYTSDLYRLDLTVGEVSPMFSSPGSREWAPRFSPKKESMVFLSDREGNDSLLIYRETTNEVTCVSRREARFAETRLPAWSPDGQSLAFYRWALNPAPHLNIEPGLWVKNLETGKEKLLVEIPMVFLSKQPVWSPNGEWIAYTQGDDRSSTVRLINVTTGELREIGNVGGHSQSLSWSSDSQTLIFVNGDSEESFVYELTLEPFLHRKLLWSHGCEKAMWVPEAGVQVFHRIRKVMEVAILESAIVTVLLEDGQKLDLIATIHVGSEDYYRRLNEKLKSYDLVLYELLGLEPNGALPPYPWTPRDSLLKKKLGLCYQSTSMNYSLPAFQHADLDAEELRAFLNKADPPLGDENLIELFKEASSQEERRSVILDGFDQYAILLGGAQYGPKLEAARHEVVTKSLNSKRAGQSQNIAILYGASHLSDLLLRLQPVRILKVEWLRAW